LRILGRVGLSIAVVIAGLLFVLFSVCAYNGSPFSGDTSEQGKWVAFAVLDAGFIAAGLWAIGKLSRKKSGGN
jgi:hypothetical protein